MTLHLSIKETNIPCEACGFSPNQKTKEVIDFTLACDLASGNKLGGQGLGKAGWKYNYHKKRYKRAFNMEHIPEDSLCKPGEKRRVIITRILGKGQRKFDKDNFIWGCKPIIDELKHRGLIFDDNPKHVEVVYKQAKGEDEFGRIGIAIEQFT